MKLNKLVLLFDTIAALKHREADSCSISSFFLCKSFLAQLILHIQGYHPILIVTYIF